MAEYEIVRSQRKTLSLQITPEGKVRVRAPMRCSRQRIDEFVKQHRAWIEKHQAEVAGMLEQRAEYRLREGDTLPWCGQRLKIRVGIRSAVQFDRAAMTLTVPDVGIPQLRPAMAKVYKQTAMPWLRQKMDIWARKMGIGYGKLSFSTATRRWGSCSANGDIRISWLLLFAPVRAIDYVLVHELAHRIEFNHSSRFWAIVEQYIPDYRQQKKILDQVHKELFRQGWNTK